MTRGKKSADEIKAVKTSRLPFVFVVLLAAGVLLCAISLDSQSQSFSNVNALGIPSLTNARVRWSDFNNDGLLDVFVSGTSVTGVLQTTVRMNNGNNTFSSINLTPLADIAVQLGDYNNDGFTDILVHGISSDQQKHSVVYRNTNGIGFLPENFGLTPLSKGSIIWNDLDHDMDLDIVVTGFDETLEERTIVYEYTNHAYQAKDDPGLTPLSNGESSVIDLESDGHAEILLTGLNAAGQAVTLLYKVDKDLNFTLFSNTLIGSAFNSVAVADFNDDQKPDFTVAGLSGGELETTAALYLNNGFSDFITIQPGFVNVASASFAVGDVDNDGLTDLILSGHDDDGFNYTKYYRNLSGNVFEDHVHTMPPIYNGGLSLGDYDNDGDLDLLQVGSSDISLQGNIYVSDQSLISENSSPAPPANLEAVTDAAQVILTWSPPADDHTASPNLTYNIYVSTDENAQNLVLASLARISDGFVKIPQQGATGNSSSFTLYNLPEGRYYWSVQAVDQSFSGSVFAAAQSFSICHTLNLGDDVQLCFNDTLDIQAGGDDDMVDWYSKTTGLLLADSRAFSHVVSANDTIVAIITKPFGCSSRDTIAVNVHPLPDITLGDDKEVCVGEELSLELSESLASVNWFSKENGLLLGNSFAYSRVVSLQDTLIAQAYTHHGCVNSDSVIIIPLALPQYDLGIDREVCFGETTFLSVADQNLSVTWTRVAANIQHGPAYELEFAVQQSDTVVAILTDARSCVGYDSLVVSVLPLPAIDVGADRNICYNETTLLELTSPHALTWLNTNSEVLASGVNQYTHLVTVKDTIIVQAIDNKACVNRDSVIVDVFPLPVFTIGADTAICQGNQILLRTGTGYQKVDWFSKQSGQALLDDSWFFNYDVVDTDTIIARVMDVHGCINFDSIGIERLALPEFSLGHDQEVCDRQQFSASIPGSWESVRWTINDDLILSETQSLDFQPQQTEDIFATVVGLNQCINYDTIRVTVLPLPTFDLGLDRLVCENDVATLSVVSNATGFAWDDGSETFIADLSSYSFPATQSKQIRLTTTDAKGCQFRDSVSIIVNPLPRFEIGGDTATCLHDRVSIHIPFQDFQHINWQTTSGDQLASDSLALKLLLTESTVVVATLTDLNGCNFSDSVFVRIRNLPISLAGEDTLLCFGETVMLGGNYPEADGLEFNWSPVEFLNDRLLPNPLANPESSITYSLQVKDIFGCVSVDSVFVDVNPQIQVDAGDNVSICRGESVSLGGNPTASGSRFPFLYEWTVNGVSVSAAPDPVVIPDVSSLYYVFVSTGRCEVFLDSIFVTVNPLPVVEAVKTFSVGAGGSVELNATGAVTYQWSPAGSLDNAFSPSPIASPLLTTRYLVEGTDANGCRDTTLVTVLVQNTIFIPSLFTPNDDGVNDAFKLYGSGAETLSLTIFNASGTPVYHTDNPADAFGHGWDGTQNGRLLPNDVYLWSISGRYINGDPVLYNGKSQGLLKLLR